ncbi:8437_t:CDS:2 [Ambispora leptoticha]|uniref:8437_t:CDS:1 n=1 Tax=Ambispora leptoticha TaxID=144679 RepID=A0A9N9FBI3_9GLOM|nr:8437_t:CDS:2 [Ambispora leptoticha]
MKLLLTTPLRNLQCLVWALLVLAVLVHSAPQAPSSGAPATTAAASSTDPSQTATALSTGSTPVQTNTASAATSPASTSNVATPSAPNNSGSTAGAQNSQSPVVTVVVTKETSTTVVAKTASTITTIDQSPTVTTTSVNNPTCFPDAQIPGKLVCADPTLYCDNTSGLCVAKQENNLPCSDESQCKSGACLNSVCADNTNNTNPNALNGNDNSGNPGVKVGIVAGIVVGIMCAIGIAFWLFNYLQRRKMNNGSRSSLVKPNYYDNADADEFGGYPASKHPEEMQSMYPFSGQSAAFSNTSPPQTLPPAPQVRNHTRIGSMGDPTQRRTSFYSNGASFNYNNDAFDGSKNNFSISRGTPVPNNMDNNENKQLPQIPPQAHSYRPSFSNDLDLSNNSDRLSKYNYLAKAFFNMRTSLDNSASRNNIANNDYDSNNGNASMRYNNSNNAPMSNATNMTVADATIRQQKPLTQSPPQQHTKSNSEYSIKPSNVNVVYNVASPQQGRELRNNLHEAAKAIQEQEDKLKRGIAATNDSKKSNQQDSALRDSNILAGDEQDEIVHSTTDSMYLGVGADVLMEPVDYTSPTGNGRYKMSSMYSTFSRDSILFSNFTNMPDVPAMPPLSSLNGNLTGGTISSTSVLPKPAPSAKTPSHNHTLSKDSDIISLNKVPRASVYTLHAPIFKSYQSSPEHQRNMSSSSLRSQIAHQRNMSQASQTSSISRHQRDFSNASQVFNPSPLSQGQGHSRNLSKSSQLSAASKYSQSSSIYSSANSADSETSSNSKKSASPTFGVSANNTTSSKTLNNNFTNITNNNSLSTKPYNINRESTSSISGASDLTSSTTEAEYDYLVPEMSTIEERMAEDELYAMSHASSYSIRTSELDLDHDLDAIRQFAENAWGTLNGGIDTSSSSGKNSNNGTFSTNMLSRSTSHLSKSSTESTATVTARPLVGGNNTIDYRIPISEDEEDPDYRNHPLCKLYIEDEPYVSSDPGLLFSSSQTTSLKGQTLGKARPRDQIIWAIRVISTYATFYKVAITATYWMELANGLPKGESVEVQGWPAENGLTTGFDLAEPGGR